MMRRIWLRSPVRHRSGPVVLLYHRVTVLDRDPQHLTVSPTRFSQHMAILARTRCPLPLGEFVRRWHDRSLPDSAVAVTFDDGYADNLHEALPILKRFEVPATVFVCPPSPRLTGEFFWDDLDRILLGPHSLPERIDLSPAGPAMCIDLGTTAAPAATAAWGVDDPTTPSSRHRAYRNLCRMLRSMPSPHRERLLSHLAEASGVGSGCRPSHRRLTPDELSFMATHPLVTIGAHTVTHPRLASLPASDQADEIADSCRIIEAIAGKRVDCFSYPFGGPTDYGAGAVAAVRNAGCRFATANVDAPMTRWRSPWELPRRLVRNVDGDDFSRLLGEPHAMDAAT